MSSDYKTNYPYFHITDTDKHFGKQKAPHCVGLFKMLSTGGAGSTVELDVLAWAPWLVAHLRFLKCLSSPWAAIVSPVWEGRC